MSTVAYVVSVLASLVLIGASTVPAVHRWFTEERGRDAVMTLSLSSAADCPRAFLTGVEEVASAPQKLDGRRLLIELASPPTHGRSIGGPITETALVQGEEGHPCR